MYRGARSIHIFGIGKIHEIHARYKGKQNGGGARHNTGQKEGDTRRYTNLGENRPHIWGKSDPYPLNAHGGELGHEGDRLLEWTEEGWIRARKETWKI